MLEASFVGKTRKAGILLSGLRLVSVLAFETQQEKLECNVSVNDDVTSLDFSSEFLCKPTGAEHCSMEHIPLGLSSYEPSEHTSAALHSF